MGASGGEAGGGGSGGEEPVFTPVGESIGPRVTQVIGPAGGSLTSLDQRFTLTVPTGALTTDTEIGIEPITATIWGGLVAYRLTPDGQTFEVPITLAYHYEKDWLLGEQPKALAVAYQTPDGGWTETGEPTLDEVNQIVSVPTTHFTDEALTEKWRLSPADALVKPGGKLTLEVESAEREFKNFAPFAPKLVKANTDVFDWGVNGVHPGNAELGMLAILPTGKLEYSAPDQVPSPEFVFPFVDSMDGTRVTSRVWVTEKYDYTGSINFMLKNSTADRTEFVSGRMRINFPPSDPSKPGEYQATFQTPNLISVVYHSLTVNYPSKNKHCVLLHDVGDAKGSAAIAFNAGKLYAVAFQAPKGVTVHCTQNYDGKPPVETDETYWAAPACMHYPLATYSDKAHLSGRNVPCIGSVGTFEWTFTGTE